MVAPSSMVFAFNDQDAVTVFFARMACREVNGPCQVCLDFCRAEITPRAYPILESALSAALTNGSLAAGFDALISGCRQAGPLTAPREG